MVFMLLLAGVFSLNGVHAAHQHQDSHLHADGKPHHHHHHEEQQGTESCAICFFHSASVTLDFSPARLPLREFVPVADMLFPHSVDYAVVIVTRWSGRAPPASSVS